MKPIAMYEKKASATDVYSLSNQFSIQFYPNRLKDLSNVFLHYAHSFNVNVLTKKVAVLSDSVSALLVPSSDHSSDYMDALIQLKNSVKADLNK